MNNGNVKKIEGRGGEDEEMIVLKDVNNVKDSPYSIFITPRLSRK